MPRFRVVITDTAKKDLHHLQANLRTKLLRELKILETSPFPTIKSIKKIKISRKIPLFRLRFGQYRIIYHMRKNVVYIFAVIHRKEFDSAIKDLIKSVEATDISSNNKDLA